MPPVLRSTWILAAVMLSACPAESEPAPQSTPDERGADDHARPSILLITLDTTRVDSFASGGATTARMPALDELATRSIVCTRAMATAPMTQPSHTSMMTGLYPFAHGVHTNGAFRLSESTVTLAEGLAEQGYRTEAFLAATVLHRETGLAQGFEHYHDVGHARGKNLAKELERPAGEISDLVLERLAVDDPRPWFFWVHYFDPHFPYAPPGAPPGLPGRRGYDAELRYTDQQIARVLAAVSADDGLQRTAIVVTADHGEGLGTGLEQTHGFLMEDPVMRVPFFVHTPGGADRGRLDMPSSGVDVFATCYALGGGDVPADRHGVDLVAAFRRAQQGQRLAADDERAVFFESQHPYHALHWAPIYGLMTREWRLRTGPSDELVALDAAGDAVDGAPEDPAALHAMKARFEQLTGGVDLTRTSDGIDLTPAQAARLRTLGYLSSSNQGEPPPDPQLLPDPRDRYPDYLLYEQAFALTTVGRAREAVEIMEDLVARYPRTPFFFDRLGRCQAAAGSIEPAVASLQKAVELDDSLINSWYFLGRAHVLKGRLPEAERCLDRALELFPGHFDARRQRADLFRRLDRQSDRLGDLIELAILQAELEPSTAEAQLPALLQQIEQTVAALTPADRDSTLERARARLPEIDEALRSQVEARLR